MGISKKIVGVFVVLCIVVLFVYGYVQQERSRLYTLPIENIPFSVLRGDMTIDVVRHLKEAGIIDSEFVFVCSLIETKQWGKFIAGKYVFSGSVSLDTITEKLVTGDVTPASVRITFPEGFTMKQMADRLSDRHLPGEAFLRLAQLPTSEVLSISPLFSDIPKTATLEGFLFPDTYEFALDAKAEDIVRIFLLNFDTRFDDELRMEAERQKKTVFEVVTLASLLEMEVRTELDRRLVSDIFSRRLLVPMPLQSDATVRYALGIDKAQYSGRDIATKSPYNTYAQKGLPIGPIANPGMLSLRAALFPIVNDFWYFLSDQETGETIFSRDFEEHKRNKALHGL